jgi:hypothetical protein
MIAPKGLHNYLSNSKVQANLKNIWGYCVAAHRYVKLRNVVVDESHEQVMDVLNLEYKPQSGRHNSRLDLSLEFHSLLQTQMMIPNTHLGIQYSGHIVDPMITITIYQSYCPNRRAHQSSGGFTPISNLSIISCRSCKSSPSMSRHNRA